MTQEPKIFPYIARLLQGAEVIWKPLGEVAELITTGKLNANAMEENGIYPFFTCNENPYKINTYAFDMEAILISGNGSQVGHINFYKGKFNAYQRTYILGNFINQILSKFLHYYLKSELRNYIITNSKKGSVPYITLPMLEKFQIPLPPLSVQQEIVCILDKFTQLEAELEAELARERGGGGGGGRGAELDCRKRQYEYYRNKLLSYKENEVEWKTLGEVTEIIRGKRVVKKDLAEEGMFAVFQNSMKPLGYYNKSNAPAQTTFIICAGAAGEIGFMKDAFWAADDVYYFKNNQNLNNKYLYYFLLTQQIKISQQVRRASIPRLSKSSFDKLLIPLPPLEEQQRIATILDKFDTLVNSISEGLPKEIALRRKQYEYYREKLLSFPKK